MPLDDDHEDKWIYRPHTKAKHEVLGKYLIPWTNKLTSYNEQARDYNKIRVIDCFAGRASYTAVDDTEPLDLEFVSTPAERPGSPQLILDRLTKRQDEYESAECVFIEANDNNHEVLENTISNTSGYSDKITTDCRNGRFEETVLDVVNDTDGSDCPTFFFIDPFGFKSLDYDVITEIGSTPRFEFLITFMSRDMNRFLRSEDHQESLNRVFGNESWINEIDDYDAENWTPLVEYYTDRLEESGPKETFEYMIEDPESAMTIYYLVFGTNHSNGLRTMRNVMSYCGTGKFAYAPKQPEYDRNQSRLIGGQEATKQFLQDRFGEYIITFNKLIQICTEERRYQDTTESDYREALRELEKDGTVDIQRISSKETGIQGSDLIDFHDSDEFIG